MNSKNKRYQPLVENIGEQAAPLNSRIERQKLDDRCGTYDADTSELVFAFLRSVKDTFAAPPRSIANADLARESFGELQALRDQVIQHRKTARALRHVLEEQRIEHENRLIKEGQLAEV